MTIAQQELMLLMGVQVETPQAMVVSSNESALTQLEIRSPIEGTVERVNFSVTERVQVGDELFVVADTSRLWVEADIRGQDWAATDLAHGQRVTVTTPAHPDTEMIASVFVATAGGYQPVRIETGAASTQRIEVRSGLHEGQLLVVQGAFVLKSELLLEGQE